MNWKYNQIQQTYSTYINVRTTEKEEGVLMPGSSVLRASPAPSSLTAWQPAACSNGQPPSGLHPTCGSIAVCPGFNTSP